MLDKSRLHALLVGGVVAFLLYALSLVPVLLGDEENSRRVILRAIVEKGLVALIGVFVGTISQPWSADAMNAVIGLAPVKAGFAVDQVTATALVVAVTITLIGEKEARAAVLAWVGRFIPGFAK